MRTGPKVWVRNSALARAALVCCVSVGLTVSILPQFWSLPFAYTLDISYVYRVSPRFYTPDLSSTCHEGRLIKCTYSMFIIHFFDWLSNLVISVDD